MAVADSFRRLVDSPTFKFVVIIALTLALSIPLLFTYFLVDERQRYAATARAAIAQMWGGEQTLRGPFVLVPTTREQTVGRGNQKRTVTVNAVAVFLPEDLKISPDVKSEIRSRGIFNVPVYRSKISFEGRFTQPDVNKIAQAGTTILWSKAVVSLLVSDVRGIKKTAEIKLNGNTATKMRAGPGISTGARHQPIGAIHLPIDEATAKSGFRFDFELDLNGSSGINFVPAGGETEVQGKSDWPHPSFAGAFLPESRKISKDGFEALWKIPRLARGQGQTLHVSRLDNLMHHTVFGVNFFQPIKFYSLAERALKYALGFIAVVFLAVFVMEMNAARRLHWIQYLFVGLALIVFYLVLIGTSEHIGFELGYLSAAAATTLLIGAYVATVTGAVFKGMQIGGVIAVIYGLVYLLLRVEDYALLIGSVAAFAMLAAVMFATRHVDWSDYGAEPGET